MKTKNQIGHGILVLFVLILLVLLGLATYLVLKKDQAKNVSGGGESVSNKDTNYLEVPFWGVKVGIGPYLEKVTLSGPTDNPVGGSKIKVAVKKEFGYYSDCVSYIEITRLTDVSGFDTPPDVKVGEFYYYNSGIGECGGAKESGNKDALSQMELKEKFKQLGVKNL